MAVTDEGLRLVEARELEGKMRAEAHPVDVEAFVSPTYTGNQAAEIADDIGLELAQEEDASVVRSRRRAWLRLRDRTERRHFGRLRRKVKRTHRALDKRERAAKSERKKKARGRNRKGGERHE